MKIQVDPDRLDAELATIIHRVETLEHLGKSIEKAAASTLERLDNLRAVLKAEREQQEARIQGGA